MAEGVRYNSPWWARLVVAPAACNGTNQHLAIHTLSSQSLTHIQLVCICQHFAIELISLTNKKKWYSSPKDEEYLFLLSALKQHFGGESEMSKVKYRFLNVLV